MKQSKDNNINVYAIMAFFVAAGFAVRMIIAWQDFALLFQKCVVDDMLFYLNIAKNISIGNGATFDGTIPTNGFHPLYAATLIPVYWLFPESRDLTFHLALTILSVFNVMTAVFIYLTVRDAAGKLAALLASFIWLFNPYVILISLNGVEVPVATFFLSASMYWYVKMKRMETFDARNLTVLGLFTGMAILGRVDSVFMFMSLTLFLFYEEYKKERRIMPALSKPLVYNIVVFSLLSPWFLWNIYHFGSIRQISGVTLPNIAHHMYLMKYNTYFSLGFLETELFYLKAWIENIVLFSGGLPFFIAVMMVFIWSVRGGVLESTRQLVMRIKIMDFALLSSALLVSFYALYFWGWLRPWYYLSVMLTMTVCLGVIAGTMKDMYFTSNPGRPLTAKHVITVLLMLSVYFMYSGNKLWEKGLFSFQKNMYTSAIWIDEHTEPGEKIGAISSGIYGYVTQRTTDLLGVVNHEAYRAMREKRIFSYMLEKDLDYLVDREDMVRFFSERFDEKGFMDRLVPIKRFGDEASDIVVYRIKHDEMNGDGS